MTAWFVLPARLVRPELQLAVAAAVALIARVCRAIATDPRPAIRRRTRRALSACGSCALVPSLTRNCCGCVTKRYRGVPFLIASTTGGCPEFRPVRSPLLEQPTFRGV
jgi:hypothetical protein